MEGKGYVKMTGVTLSAAERSVTPASPIDRYVRVELGTSNELDAEIVNDMWNGRYTFNNDTVETIEYAGAGTGYEVKNVVVHTNILLGIMPEVSSDDCLYSGKGKHFLTDGEKTTCGNKAFWHSELNGNPNGSTWAFGVLPSLAANTL
jgi:hypothetical protein